MTRLHYKEYLGTLIYQNRIDPITIFSEVELELVLRRENIRIPNQRVRNLGSMGRAKEVFSKLEAGASGSSATNAADDEAYRKMLVDVSFIFLFSKVYLFIFVFLQMIMEKVPLDLWE